MMSEQLVHRVRLVVVGECVKCGWAAPCGFTATGLCTNCESARRNRLSAKMERYEPKQPRQNKEREGV